MYILRSLWLFIEIVTYILLPNLAEIVRQMSGGHKRTLEILPTNYEWRKFKDHLVC